MALEIYLHQQKLDLTASLNADEKTYDLLLTSRGVGDGDSILAASHASTARDTAAVNQEDMVNQFSTEEKTLIGVFFFSGRIINCQHVLYIRQSNISKRCFSTKHIISSNDCY